MRSLLVLAARNHVFANLFKFLLLVGGYMAVGQLIREFFPSFEADAIQVQVAYPGGIPEEIEEGICLRLEEAVEGIDGIKRTYTMSSDGLGAAFIELEEDLSDPDRVFNDVRNRIEAVKTFPRDAEKPVVSQLIVRQLVLNLCLSGNASEFVLKELAEEIKDELLAISGVARVIMGGARSYEIAVEVSEEKLRAYGLSLGHVAAAVRQGAINLPGGTVFGDRQQLTIRTMGRRYRAKEFADLVVAATPEGRLIRLEEIATLSDTFEEISQYGVFNRARGVIMSVFKVDEADNIDLAAQVSSYVAQKKTSLPAGIDLTAWSDMSRIIKGRLNLLTRNGLMGMSLVFFSLLLFLGLRLSFWVALGIPVSFAGAFIVMFMTGQTLNLITLFGLIMTLGIIVDDAIIVGESISHARERGEAPFPAAIVGVTEVVWPVVAAVTTTVLAFLPLFFVKGSIGKFIWMLPATVVPALVTSLFESLFLLPSHLSNLPPNRSDAPRFVLLRWAFNVRRRFRDGFFRFVDHIYRPFLQAALRRRYLTMLSMLATMAIGVGLLLGGHIKYTFFPSVDTDIIKMELEMPPGTPAAVTQQALDRFSGEIMAVGEKLGREAGLAPGASVVHSVWAAVGVQPKTLPEPRATGDHQGYILVELLPTEERGVASAVIMDRWRAAVTPLPEGRAARSLHIDSAIEHPGGEPIEIRLFADRMEPLVAAAREVRAALRSFSGVYDDRDDYPGERPELQFKLKPTARVLGLKLEDLAVQVKQGWYGEEALRIQRGRDDVRIKIRYPRERREGLAELDRMRIRTADGREIPLREVADVTIVRGSVTILRENGRRRIVIKANVEEGTTSAGEVLAALESKHLTKIPNNHKGVTYSLEGQSEEQRESMESLKQGFIFAVLGILLILATTFRSYVQPVLILCAIPMGGVGALLGHILLGFDLSIMSMFGMVALSGIVVNDAIVLVERFNENLADGQPFHDALLNAATRRFRAIVLTTVTTSLGLMPLIAERSLQAQFLIPMAISVTFGVAFATILTLVVLPALIVILSDVKCSLAWAWRGVWPVRERMEPAQERRRGGTVATILALILVLPVMTGGCIAAGDRYRGGEAVEDLQAVSYDRPPAGGDTLPPVLSLEVARRLTVKNNPDMARAAARVAAAKARALQAFSPYLPTVDLNVTYSHTFDVPKYSFFVILPQDFESYETVFQGSWLLFDGFVREFNYRSASSALEQSRAAFDDVKRLLLLATDQTYYQAQLAREALRISQADFEFNRKLLDETRKRKAVGKASRSDVYNFELRLKAAEGNAVASRKLLRLNYIILEEILALEEDVLGSTVELDPLREETRGLLHPPAEGFWLDWALKRRPDLAALSYEVERSDADIAASNGAWSPSVFLSGQYGWQKFDNMRYHNKHTASALSLGLGWHIFTGTSRLGRLHEAHARYDEAVANLRKGKLAAISQVRQAVNEVNEAQKQVAIEKRSAELAGLTRDLVEKEYRAGKASLTRLNEVQRDFVQAEARYARARILLREAWSELRAASGWRDGDTAPTPGD